MKKRKVGVRIVALVLILCIMCAGAANAVQVTINLYAQNMSNWCWAACSVSCIKYTTGATVAQVDFVYDAGLSENVKASPSEVSTGLAVNSVYSTNGTYSIGAANNYKWSGSTHSVVSQIDAYRPVIIGGETLDTGVRHMELVIGYGMTGTHEMVKYKNPSPVGTGYSNDVYWSDYTAYNCITFGDPNVLLYYDRGYVDNIESL